MMAMSWNLFHKIANFIIYYGTNIIGVYNNLLTFAQRQLNIRTDIVWLPIIFLLVVFALFGLLAGVIEILVGKKMLEQPESYNDRINEKPEEGFTKQSDGQFDYSIA